MINIILVKYILIYTHTHIIVSKKERLQKYTPNSGYLWGTGWQWKKEKRETFIFYILYSSYYLIFI